MGHRNKVTHSEAWWEMLAPPTAVRCEGHYKQDGKRCRREAVPGANVCGQHGGLIPVVRAKAAARIGNAADEMVQRLQAMLDDPNVEARDKIKIAQDLLDRAGLNATEKHIVGVGPIDPVERLFQDLLADPNNLGPAIPLHQAPDPEIAAYNRAALEAYGGDEDSPVVLGEVVEYAVPAANDKETMSSKPPPHIAKALKELGL